MRHSNVPLKMRMSVFALVMIATFLGNLNLTYAISMSFFAVYQPLQS